MRIQVHFIRKRYDKEQLGALGLKGPELEDAKDEERRDSSIVVWDDDKPYTEDDLVKWIQKDSGQKVLRLDGIEVLEG